MVATIADTATIGNVPAASGQGCQSHLVFGVNSNRWFCFFNRAGDNTHVNCYVSSSADLASATWAAIGTGATSPVPNSGYTFITATEGRNLAATYKNIGGYDVVYVVVGTSDTLNATTVQVIRVTLTATVATWGSWNNAAWGPSGALNDPDGSAIAISSTNRAHAANSRIRSDRDLEVSVATNLDSGSAWTAGFSGNYIVDNTPASVVQSGALFPLASGYMLAICDDADAAASCVNHFYVNSESENSWPGPSAGAKITATDTSAGESKSDWAAVGVSTTDVHFVRRNGTTTFEHFRFNGSSWGTVITMPTLPTAHKAGSGIFLATDASAVWCFYIGTDNAIRYAKWTSGGGWDAAWSTLTTNGNTKNYLSGYSSLANSQINLLWMEGSNPYALTVGTFIPGAAGPVTSTRTATPITVALQASPVRAATPVRAALVKPVGRRANGTATVAGGTRTTTTVSKPSGVVDGDCMLMQLYIESTATVTPPANWLELPGSPIVGAVNDVRFYYKIAASEPASWDWTHPSAWTGVNFATYFNVDPVQPIFPVNGITATKAVIDNTAAEIVAPNFTIGRDGSMLIGCTSTANGRSLTNHRGMVTVACWSGANGTELTEEAGPWDGVDGHVPFPTWNAGDSSGATTGERRFVFNAPDYLTAAVFALQPALGAARTATPVTASLATVNQHAYPVSPDVAAGNWTQDDGVTTTNLWSRVDEPTADDADYIQSGADPASDICTLTLGSLTTPGDGSRTLHYRYAKDAGSERVDLVVELLEGVSVVHTWTHNDIPTGWTQADSALDPADTISNYGNLRIRLTATQV